MSEIKVKDLANVTTLSNNNKLMVLTNSSNNMVKNITVANAISGIISSDADNKIVHGSDGKLYVESFGNITGDLDNLTTTNKTNLVNAINEVNGNVGTLSNLETTEKSNLVSAINEIANIVEPSLQYDVMNNSKAMETGGVYSNSVIYQDVYKYAHSTFDRSKFSIYGSPIISSDGVARVAENNFLQQWLTINSNSIIFKGRFLIESETTNYRSVFSALIASDAKCFTELRVKQDGFYLIYASSSTGRGNVNHSYNFSLNTWYDYEIVYNGTTLDLLINGVSVITPVTPYFETITRIKIGVTFADSLAFSNGWIDLKYVSVIENGIPTFSGNKTGLDIIKPDNFETVGTPTITSDGIATFESGQYLEAFVPDLVNAQNITIEAECIIESDGSGYSMLVIDKSGANYGLVLWRNGTRIQLRCNTNSNLAGFAWTANKKYHLKVEKVGNNATFTATSDGQTIYTSTVDVSDMLPFSGNIEIGNRNVTPTTAYWQGTIDLNAVKFNINGAVKYQPCLKIPYIKSADKYGSKFVDVLYRSRVNDVYEQGYPQKYYTIDEVNNSFTLPMGEIFGMIERRANADLSNVNITSDFATTLNNAGIVTIVDYYFSGTSYYYTFSNNVCVQGGSVLVVEENQTVNLLKNYIDTNYVVISGGGTKRFGDTAAYDKTTSRFTAWTSDDYSFNAGIFNWQATGKIA